MDLEGYKHDITEEFFFCIIEIKGGLTLAPTFDSLCAQRIYSCSNSRGVEKPGIQPASQLGLKCQNSHQTLKRLHTFSDGQRMALLIPLREQMTNEI